MASADCDFLKWVLVLLSPTVETNKYNGPTAEDWPFDDDDDVVVVDDGLH